MQSNILTEVIADMQQREKIGIKKYNTTMDRQDLELVDWLQHAYEENLDKSLYLKSAINKLKHEKLHS